MSIDAAAPAPPSRLDRLVHAIGRLGERSGPVPVLALALAGMLLVQLDRSIHDTDIFWQLKLGEITLADGLPRHEPFLAGREHEPLAPVAWLAQAVYAGIRQTGGWTLLWLADALVWFGGFVVVAAACHRRAANAWPVAVGLWVGWFAALPTASVRPQSFAALAFGLLVVLIRANRSPARTAILGAALFVLWQNLHPSVVVGGLAVGAACGAEGLQYLRKRRAALPWRLFVLLPLAALATIATPAGLDIFRISRLNAELSLHLNVMEWMPLTWNWRTGGRPFAAAMLLSTAAALALRGRNATAPTLAIVLAFTSATLYSHRFVLFWGIAVIPLWYELFGSETAAPPARSPWRRPLAVLAFTAALGIAFARHPARFAENTPFDGVRALRASGVRGTVFTNFYWGGLVAEAGYPHWRVTHDGRYYLHTAAEWDRYHAITVHGGGGMLDDILARYRPDAFFLWPGADHALIALLEKDPRWRELHADPHCVVYVPAAVR